MPAGDMTKCPYLWSKWLVEEEERMELVGSQVEAWTMNQAGLGAELSTQRAPKALYLRFATGHEF